MSKKKRGKGARKFFAFVGVTCIVILGGAIALRLVLTPERLQTAIVDAATDATGLDVHLDEAYLSFLPFGISLTGLRLEESDEQNKASQSATA